MRARSSLRTRLAVGLTILACLGVGLQFAVFDRVSERMRDDVARRNRELAHALAGEVGNALAQPEYALSALARMLASGLSGEALDVALGSIHHFTKIVGQVQVINASGRLVAASPAMPDSAGADFSSKPFFRVAREKQGLVYSEANVPSQNEGGGAVISESFPGGVASLHLRIEELSRMAMVLPSPQGGFIAVVDGKGSVIGHSDPQAAVQRESLLNMAVVRRGFDGVEGTNEEVYAGVRGIASVAPVSTSGWLVIVFEPASLAYSSVRNLYSYTLGGVVIVALCSVLAMVVFRAQLLRPVENLTAQTRAVARGNYSIDITPGFREFEDLAESFSTMVANLKIRERALDNSRRRLSAVVDAMPSFLASIGSSGRIEQWNVEAEKLTNIPAREALGKTLEQTMPQLTSALPGLGPTAAMSIPAKWEKLTVDFGSGRRIVDVLVYPLSSGGDMGAVLRIDDITDRIRMEEVMVHTEKMMTVGGLAAGMAHEINNPLGGILMSAQNLARRLSPDLPANRVAAQEAGIDLGGMRAYLEKRGVFQQVETIRELGARAGKIVANMLGFSRRSHSGYIPARIDELIERALDLAANDYELKRRLDFKTIKVVRDFSLDLGEAPVNRNQIEQVLLNLFKNAAQAMAETADIRAPELWIRASRTSDDAVITVRDNGPGIRKEDAARIFEPFFTTKEVGEGTGLGLSVSYYIVTTMHNGSITVKSTPGEGAAFILTLPLRRSAKQQQSQQAANA
ncbi:ATP-binding protein [Fundidesulfovibrio terrae]|uniref:ATP-binding protein n=1 Tax=Fundidesulfovibrio terrae TaxID=2922866 RepID=UPI001FAFD334|nr:ATP-binding protein [Fundidesulfovibrio terrae]